MRTGFPLWRLAPEPWVGLSVPYDPDWTKNVLGPMVDTRAFDRQSKTWWMPRAFEPAVSQAVRENKNFSLPDAAIDKARVDIYRDKTLLAGASAASDYALLGLHPSCPPQLVDWALAFYRQAFAYYGAPTTQLLLVEEAYARIMNKPTGGG
jgi:hypothetical protein